MKDVYSKTYSLRDLKSSYQFVITKTGNQVVTGATVSNVPFFSEIESGWVDDGLHQHLTEVIFESPVKHLRLTREFTLWKGETEIKKTINLEIIDHLIAAADLSDFTVNMVESILTEFPKDAIRHHHYMLLHQDAECRLYTHMHVFDDPTQDRGVGIDVHIILNVVPFPTSNIIYPSIPVTQLFG